MTSQPLTIGRLAREAGVNVETIRYYQRLGLIQEPAKPIKRAQGLGFTLAEIGELLALDGASCATTQQLASEKLGAIRAKLQDLSRMAGVLEELISACDRQGGQAGCPILDILSEDAPEA